MAHSQKYPAISDRDIEIIDNFLSRNKNGEIQNFEILDGFLTSLIIGPEFVPPSEFIPIIATGSSGQSNIFKNEKEFKLFFDIIMRHWNNINETYNNGDIYMPYLLEDDQGVARANDWATGFLKGTELHRGTWVDLLNNDEITSQMIPIFALKYENSEDPSMRSYKDTITNEQRENLLMAMIAGVKRLYDLFRAAEEELNNMDEMLISSKDKTSRNDLCPCGSGKKFKKCCALKTFH